MCTVSWRQTEERYDLFFNRDELRSRAAEHPPTLDAREGVHFIMPRDGQAGGTWLAANDHGVTVCLLNDYANPWRPAAAGVRFSRGHIVADAADARTLDIVLRRVQAQPLPLTAPFQLLALQPGEAPLLLHWSGAALLQSRREFVPPLLTSSSFATATVIAARFATFERLVRVPAHPTVEELAYFHRHYDPAAGACSVSMSRPDASTRSTIRVSVDPAQVALSYTSPQVSVALHVDRVRPPAQTAQR